MITALAVAVQVGNAQMVQDALLYHQTGARIKEYTTGPHLADGVGVPLKKKTMRVVVKKNGGGLYVL